MPLTGIPWSMPKSSAGTFWRTPNPLILLWGPTPQTKAPSTCCPLSSGNGLRSSPAGMPCGFAAVSKPQFQNRRFSAARAESAMRVWLHCRQAPRTDPGSWPPSLGDLSHKSCRTEYVTRPFRPLRPRGKGRSQSLRLFSPGNGPGSYAQKPRNQKGNYPGIKQGRF